MRQYERTKGDVIFSIVNYSVFIIFTIICIFPFYYIFINTISGNDLVSKGLILWKPEKIHFINYMEILKIKGLGRATMVTLARTVLGTGLSLISTSFVAYALTRQELWLRKFWYRYFVITMYFSAGIIPWYITMKNLHLTNNFLAYIIGVINPFNLILIKTYIESIPASLEESAEMDGAGYGTRFLQLIIPLSKPILATVIVFTAVSHWNSFMDTLFLMTDSKLYTLQFLLWQYLNEANALAASMRAASSGAAAIPAQFALTSTAIKMTISMVVVIPILFVYPLFQRYFMKGIMVGAVKG